MSSVLPNLREDLLYQYVPPAVADLDTRGLMQAVLGGFQDRVADVRSYLGRYPDLIKPAPDPLVCVLVRYQVEPGGNVAPVTLNADDTTPEDPAELVAWSAAQLGIDPATVVSAVIGTDALRVIGVDTVQLLAQTLGAVLYPGLPGEDPALVAQRRALTLTEYFPRLRLKGTPQSFSIFARLAGFDDGTLIPLWTRLSPRVPQDVGAPPNLGDLRARADILPTSQLPDPAGTYNPTAFMEGPFFAWNSGSVVADPGSPNFYPSVVNGRNPFISLIASGPVIDPPAGAYVLVGGEVGRVASVPLSSGTIVSNLTARALTDGAAFNGVMVTVSGSGTSRELDIIAQLSTVQYRASYFDTALWRVNAGTQAVSVNPDLMADPGLVPDGTATAPYRPWSDGTAAAVEVTLWPARSVVTTGTSVPRHQAVGTTIEVDVAALTADAQRVYDQFGEVRAATRLPRRSSVGLMNRDDIMVSAYPCVAALVVPAGTGSYGGIVGDVYRPAGSYAARFSLLHPPSLPSALTVQSTTAGTFSFAGAGITGSYLGDSGVWSAHITGAYTGGTLTGLWSDPSSDTIRSEPSNAAKQAGTVCYVTTPEGTMDDSGWDGRSWDDVPWMRMLRAGGERVDTNLFIPFNDPNPVRQETWEARLPSSTGIPQIGLVYDLVDVPQPPYLRIRTPENEAPAPFSAAYAGSGTQLYPVIAVSPTTIVAAATWNQGRYNDALLWWPLNEQPAQALMPTPALGPAPEVVSMNPGDRRWDTARGWALALTTGGTVTGDVGLPDQYGFAVTARTLPGSNAGSREPHTVRVGAASLTFVPSWVTLTVDDGDASASALLPIAPDTNTLVYVNVGTTSSTFGLGTPQSWGTTATLSAAPPRGLGDVRLTAAPTPVQLHDLMVWSTRRTHEQLDALRAPVLTPVHVPVQRPYIAGVSGDRWALEVLPCAFVVPSGTLAAPEVYPAGDVVRYEGTGRYVGNPAYKQVGLGGSQTLPARLTLGVVGPSVPALGRVVVSGTNGEPGYNVSWAGSTGTIFSVVPPYSATGGLVVGSVVTIPDHWPPALPQYNAATDRVYVVGDNGYAYQVGIDDIGAGPVFTATIPLQPRPPRELPFVAPNLRAGREVVSDFESRLTSFDEELSVTTSGTVYAFPHATGGFLLTEAGLYLLTEDDQKLALEHDFDTAPFFLYLNSRVKSWAQNAYTRWVNPNAFGRGLGVAALETAGSLVFENVDALPRGNYRLSVDAGNLGTVDDQFAGFNVDVTITTGVGDPIAFSVVLLPTGTGTDPRGWTPVEFTLPYSVVGPWRMTFDWTNDRDVPSRGQVRRLAVYAYTMRRVASELHMITVGPLAITPIDVAVPPFPLQAGAYVASFNSYGTIASYEHEQNLYGRTEGDDTFNNPRSPLADTLTGSTLQRRDRLDMPAPYQPGDPVAPVAPTAGSVVVDPIKSYYNVGDVINLLNTGATGFSELRRTWHLWGSGTVTTLEDSALSAVVNQGGALPISVDVVDALGNSARASTSIPVNTPPSIQVAAASLAFAPAPFATNLSAVIADADGDAFVASWYRLGPVPALIGVGTTVDDYVVDSTQTVRVVAVDVRGGTNFADVPLTASANGAPVASIVAINPAELRASSVAQILQLAATARDPENQGVTTEWEFWDGVTVSGNTRSMQTFGGGTYCTVERTVVNETVGSKAFTLTVSDVDGNTSQVTGAVTVVENTPPVILQMVVSNPGVKAGTPLMYAASAYDPNGGDVNYSWEFPALNLVVGGANVSIDTTGMAGKSIGGRLRVSNDYGAETVRDAPGSAVFEGGLSPITIDPAGGVTSQGVVLTIASPDSSVIIRYTLDGSEPAAVTDGILYTGPVMVPYQAGATVPVNARAFKDTLAPSTLAAVTFVFT